MALSTRKTKPKKAANGYVLPDEKLKQRELAFAIYRDLGPARSMNRLQIDFAKAHPTLAVSLGSLENWSVRHDWANRVKAHDEGLEKARAQGITPQARADIASPEFNQIDALLAAANKAPTRAMGASPVVTKPSDVKSLVDAAANALKLAEVIKSQSSGKVSRQDVANEVVRILDELEKARFLDVEQLVEAELKRRGIAIDVDGAQVNPVAPVQVDAAAVVDIDAGTVEELQAVEADLVEALKAVDGVVVDTAAMPVDLASPAPESGSLLSFADALKSFVKE